jgi:hypothetical protein
MAKVWLVYRGPEPTKGEALLTEITIDQCVSVFGLRGAHWHSTLSSTPKFREKMSEMAGYLGPSYAVVEIGDAEAACQRWRAGFYLLEMTPDEVRKRVAQ